MTSLINYLIVNKNFFKINQNSCSDNNALEVKAENIFCRVIGIIGVSYQIYLLLCG
ncbi:MAG: hypothetical protein WCI45_01730 [Desulfuromonadales bacterium]